MSSFHATTIFAVQHKGKSAMAGDGQVTFGQAVVMKHTAKKKCAVFSEAKVQVLQVLQVQ
ncbi:hypothetical protein BsIDN1_29470 [Bacillus safensis]|uniref:Uncharacterized protein n=1 Tax=Bacillus safensis TaxID=561879 RepID=A0A5S9MBL0_BACIA|nr:hypothetical protein BsIDN1_29470 [Bacillus safensis]